MRSLVEVLRTNTKSYGQVVPVDLRKERLHVFDFSAHNHELRKVNIASPEEFGRYIRRTLSDFDAHVGIGDYNEDRTIYRHSPLFITSEGEARTVHLGIDIFLPEGTTVLSPLDGFIHSYQNNVGIGDNGPTIVLQHCLDDVVFYTLYSHLSEDSLDKSEGASVRKGDMIGRIGNMHVNGCWPPHLHVQVIQDMCGRKGDFYGVISLSRREEYTRLCPDPNLILCLPIR